MKKRLASIASLILFVAIATLVQMSVSGKALENDRLVVWVFDVGQGDSIFIDAPDAQILVDGGPSTVVLEKLASVMPFWDRSIDIIVNTHPHADHVTGLNYVLERYWVGEVWVSGQEYSTDVFTYFESLTTPLSEGGARGGQSGAKIVFKGQEYDLGGGAKMTVIWPETSLDGIRLDDVNDGSISILIEYGDTTIFLPGDIGLAQEEQIINSLPHIDVLKVAHQGSMTSSGSGFLATVTPDIAIIPVGENTYGHPSPIVVQRLELFGAEVLRTDEDGDIRIISDGGEPWVSVFEL